MANIKIPRESIIDAAFEITKEQGIEAATAAAIAKRLNISERPHKSIKHDDNEF